MLGSGREFAWIAFERFRIDLPAEIIVGVPRNYTARRIQLDDFAAHRDAFILGAVPIGVVEERLDPARRSLALIASPIRARSVRLSRTPQTLEAASAVPSQLLSRVREGLDEAQTTASSVWVASIEGCVTASSGDAW